MMQTFSSVTCSPQLRLYLKIVAAVDGLDAETGSEEEELEFARKKDVHVELGSGETDGEILSEAKDDRQNSAHEVGKSYTSHGESYLQTSGENQVFEKR